MSALKDKGDFGKSPHQPTRYELIDKDGKFSGYTSESVTFLAGIARRLWPDQEQDEERTGKGWDVQVVGADQNRFPHKACRYFDECRKQGICLDAANCGA